MTLVRPQPVLFACRGCERGHLAADVAAALDRRGVAEACLAGFDAAKARSRFPVCAVEGCDQACATAWLAQLRVRPSLAFTLDPSQDAAAAIETVAAGLVSHAWSVRPRR